MNILLLTSIYPIPGPENQGTKVCHFFAKEWAEMGHRVLVVHYQSTYPAPFYWAAKLFQKRLAAKTGAIIYTHKEKNIARFEMDGVDVIRIPLYKSMPHGRFPKKNIKKSVDYILANNNKDGFVPDMIVGHFLNPQLEVLNLLKGEYKDAKTGLIYHLPAEIDMAEKLYGSDLKSLYASIDVFGFRNEPLKHYFEKHFSKEVKSFICYSGIPENYITKENKRQFNGELRNYIYVGGLIERKYPAQILDALHEVYPQGGFMMHYVGGGQQKEAIENIVKEYGIKDSVFMHGKIDRDKILALYDQSDCMIMISKGEAYGLVYLEAMARGCITIASRDEGMDGVIKDGYNGFLCASGNSSELATILKHINSLGKEEKTTISMNAILTAKELTDKLVAEKYLKDVIA